MRLASSASVTCALLLATSPLACSAGSHAAPATDGGVDGLSFDASPSDADLDPDGACAVRSFSGAKLPLTIAIVFDQSSSMSEGSPAKIDVAKAGLRIAFSDPRFDDVAVGLFRFGYQSGRDGCIWDTEPTSQPAVLTTSRASLLAEIDKLTPSGATPTYSALNAAYGWLAPKIYARTPPEDGRVVVVLVTDGAPTCGGESVDDYVTLVRKGRKATIDTFAIGLPGSDEKFDSTSSGSPSAAAFLSKLAANGTDPSNLPPGCDVDPTPITNAPAKPCYFDMHAGFSADKLAAAFENVRRAASSCEYGMPALDPSLDAAHPAIVITDGAGTRTSIPRCTSASDPGVDGCWDWGNPTHTQVKIFGAACARVRDDAAAKVDVLLRCNPR